MDIHQIRKLQIGSVTLPNNLILGPMAGVTDLPFRLLCKEQGAGLLCMEMVSAKAIAYHNRNTERLMEINDREHPVSLQLFGSEPDLMAEIAAQIEDKPFDILDINMGCPVGKVIRSGDGSALMRDPELAGRIIEAVVKAVDVPVTVKFRKGWDGGNVNAVAFAQMCQQAGAAAIGILVAVLNQLLIRSGREEQAMMTTLAGLVVVMMILVQEISGLFQMIKTLFDL